MILNWKWISLLIYLCITILNIRLYYFFILVWSNQLRCVTSLTIFGVFVPFDPFFRAWFVTIWYSFVGSVYVALVYQVIRFFVWPVWSSLGHHSLYLEHDVLWSDSGQSCYLAPLFPVRLLASFCLRFSFPCVFHHQITRAATTPTTYFYTILNNIHECGRKKPSALSIRNNAYGR